jgi:hypothetical protein
MPCRPRRRTPPLHEPHPRRRRRPDRTPGPRRPARPPRSGRPRPRHEDDLRTVAYQLMDAAGRQRVRLTGIVLRARTSSTLTRAPSRSSSTPHGVPPGCRAGPVLLVDAWWCGPDDLGNSRLWAADFTYAAAWSATRARTPASLPAEPVGQVGDALPTACGCAAGRSARSSDRAGMFACV